MTHGSLAILCVRERLSILHLVPLGYSVLEIVILYYIWLLGKPLCQRWAFFGCFGTLSVRKEFLYYTSVLGNSQCQRWAFFITFGSFWIVLCVSESPLLRIDFLYYSWPHENWLCKKWDISCTSAMTKFSISKMDVNWRNWVLWQLFLREIILL